MYFRILRKDLKRKKSIHLILLAFIFLSTMFIAGSLNNFAVILNGVENFMDQSGLGDFLIVTLGGSKEELSENDKDIEEFLKDQEQEINYTVDDQLFFTENQLKTEDGEKVVLGGTSILNSFDIRQDRKSVV